MEPITVSEKTLQAAAKRIRELFQERIEKALEDNEDIYDCMATKAKDTINEDMFYHPSWEHEIVDTIKEAAMKQ